jgi:Family of unknown function (DUF5317)
MIFAFPAALGLAVVALRLLLARRKAPAAGAAPSSTQVPAGGARLRWWPVAPACAAVQLYLMLGRGVDPSAPWRTALLWGTYAVLAAVMLINLRRRWMWLFAAGLLLNAIVMAANGGLMPVSPETLVRAGNGHVLARLAVGQPLPRSKDVILPAEDTRLAFLSDVLVLPGQPGSFSPGDAFIAVGIFLVLQASAAQELAAASGRHLRAAAS